MVKRFRTATLQSDGTAVVKGPFTLERGDPQKPALVAFYLVQESSSGDGEPNSTTVGGDGRWSIGETNGSGTCDGALLKAGHSMGIRDGHPRARRTSGVRDLDLDRAIGRDGSRRHSYLSTNAEKPWAKSRWW